MHPADVRTTGRKADESVEVKMRQRRGKTRWASEVSASEKERATFGAERKTAARRRESKRRPNGPADRQDM